MMFFHDVYLLLDQVLIAPFRMVSIPIVGYFWGTFCLAFSCVFLGRMTAAAAWAWNRDVLLSDNREMVRMHNLSFRALAAKDKKAYKACNKQANDAFGKFFFSRMAMGMASLWPLPFALAWMGGRFGDVAFALPLEVPLIGGSVGYTFTFIPLYVLSAILFGKLRRWIPLFARMDAASVEDQAEMEQMMSLADLAPARVGSESVRRHGR